MNKTAAATSGEQHQPRVSIGLPIYNEGRFIEKTLDALLAQSYGNIEIIISDNGSTDNCPEICQSHAARDPRIHFHQYQTNQGIAINSSRVLELANGDYFMWASGHDLWSEHLVSRCVDALQASPDAALAYTASNWIDTSGEVMDQESGIYDTRGMNCIGRFFTAFWGNMHPVLGILRMRYMDEIPKIQGCAGSDLLVLTELALKGDFLYVADALWSRREIRGQETYREKLDRYKSKEFSLVSSRFDKLLPLFRLPWELLRVVLRARIRLVEKLSILLVLVPSLLARYVEGGR